MGYFELMEDERPPDGIWGNDAALEQWFDDVKIRRSSTDSGPMEPVPEMTQNSLLSDIGFDRG